jgi:hypothetical protein
VAALRVTAYCGRRSRILLSSIMSLEVPTATRRISNAKNSITEQKEKIPRGSLVFLSKIFTRGFIKSAIIHANIKGKI